MSRKVLVLSTALMAAVMMGSLVPANASFGGYVIGDIVIDGGPDGSQQVIGHVRVGTGYNPSYFPSHGRWIELSVELWDGYVSSGWHMTAIQIEVLPGEDPSFPTNKNGNPKVGQFYLNDQGEDTSGISFDFFYVPGEIDASGKYPAQTINIAIHLDVYNTATLETAGAWAVSNYQSPYWSTTKEFSGPSWATYISYVSPAGLPGTWDFSPPPYGYY